MEGQAKSSWFGTATETGFRRAILQSVLITLITWFGGPTPSAAQEPDDGKDQQVSTADDFLRLTLGPIAIGHHGVGPYNPATNPGLPIENTVDSVKLAYSLGARVVEVDVQLTQDGKLAVFHDDFLSVLFHDSSGHLDPAFLDDVHVLKLFRDDFRRLDDRIQNVTAREPA